ncbi:MAG: hypothetical protein V9G14_04305 [Cypionkella sp.]
MEKILNLPVVASEHGHDVERTGGTGPLADGHPAWSAGRIFFIYTLVPLPRVGRDRKADYHGVRGHASTWLEVGVASFEAVLLIGFADPAVGQGRSTIFRRRRTPPIIRVVAEQFGWNFIYPGADGKFGRAGPVAWSRPRIRSASTQTDPGDQGQLHGPQRSCTCRVEASRVILNCSSKDVIHSFKVVPLRVTQDCIPGLNIPTHFVPTKEGKYQVICAQLCGNGHAAMANGMVVVDSESGLQDLDGFQIFRGWRGHLVRIGLRRSPDRDRGRVAIQAPGPAYHVTALCSFDRFRGGSPGGVAACLTSSRDGRGPRSSAAVRGTSPMPVIREIRDFALTNQAGATLAKADLLRQTVGGQPDLHPMPGTLRAVIRGDAYGAERDAQRARQARLLSLTSDPEFDTPHGSWDVTRRRWAPTRRAGSSPPVPGMPSGGWRPRT